LDLRLGCWVSEASTSEGLQKGGVLSSCLGGVSPSFA
jgi:hypothetical protein